MRLKENMRLKLSTFLLALLLPVTALATNFDIGSDSTTVKKMLIDSLLAKAGKTGVVVADSLFGSSGARFVGALRVGWSATDATPTGTLSVKGDLIVTAGNAGINQSAPLSPNSSAGFLHLGASGDASTGLVIEDNNNIWEFHMNNSLYLYDGTTIVQSWRADGHVGIGTTDPNQSGWGGTTTTISSTTRGDIELWANSDALADDADVAGLSFMAGAASPQRLVELIAEVEGTSENSGRLIVKTINGGATAQVAVFDNDAQVYVNEDPGAHRFGVKESTANSTADLVRIEGAATSGTDNQNLVYLFQDYASSTGHVLRVENDGTGASIGVIQDGNGQGINLNNSGTNDGMYITQGGVLGAGQYGLILYSNAEQVNAQLAYFHQDNASSTTDALEIVNDGTGYGISADISTATAYHADAGFQTAPANMGGRGNLGALINATYGGTNANTGTAIYSGRYIGLAASGTHTIATAPTTSGWTSYIIFLSIRSQLDGDQASVIVNATFNDNENASGVSTVSTQNDGGTPAYTVAWSGDNLQLTNNEADTQTFSWTVITTRSNSTN